MPRAASISSTIRELSGKRKWSHTAWPMTSGGKRWPAYEDWGGVMPGR